MSFCYAICHKAFLVDLQTDRQTGSSNRSLVTESKHTIYTRDLFTRTYKSTSNLRLFPERFSHAFVEGTLRFFWVLKSLTCLQFFAVLACAAPRLFCCCFFKRKKTNQRSNQLTAVKSPLRQFTTFSAPLRAVFFGSPLPHADVSLPRVSFFASLDSNRKD